jgi:hypothetical protein
MSSLKALRDELKLLVAATEDKGLRLAELEAKARPYTLNPNGFVRRTRPVAASARGATAALSAARSPLPARVRPPSRARCAGLV